MEVVAISAIVISIITALGALIARLRCKHCHAGCIDSDCINTPPTTPPTTPPIDGIYTNTSDYV